MEDNELMLIEDEDDIEEVEDMESHGISTGIAMLIGGGIAAAAIAGGMKLKKVWENRKAKKEVTVKVKVKTEDEDIEDDEYDDSDKRNAL